MSWPGGAIDLSEGWRHEALGAGLFVVVLGLIWSTDRLLLFLTASSAAAPPKPRPRPTDRVAAAASASPRAASPAGWAFAAAYSLFS